MCVIVLIIYIYINIKLYINIQVLDIADGEHWQQGKLGFLRSLYFTQIFVTFKVTSSGVLQVD